MGTAKFYTISKKSVKLKNDKLTLNMNSTLCKNFCKILVSVTQIELNILFFSTN